MGISNRQRRQTKKRRQATRDQRSASERTQPPGWSEGDSSSSRRSESSEALDEMIGIAAHWAHGPQADADLFERALIRLVAFGNMSGETRPPGRDCSCSQPRVCRCVVGQRLATVRPDSRRASAVRRACRLIVHHDGRGRCGSGWRRSPRLLEGWIHQLTALDAADSALAELLRDRAAVGSSTRRCRSTRGGVVHFG